MKAIAKHESGWQSNAVSCDGAYGLMQLMAQTEKRANRRLGPAPEDECRAHGYSRDKTALAIACSPETLGWKGAAELVGMSPSIQRTLLDLQMSCATVGP